MTAIFVWEFLQPFVWCFCCLFMLSGAGMDINWDSLSEEELVKIALESQNIGDKEGAKWLLSYRFKRKEFTAELWFAPKRFECNRWLKKHAGYHAMMPIMDFLILVGAANSNNEARRLLKQGSVKIQPPYLPTGQLYKGTEKSVVRDEDLWIVGKKSYILLPPLNWFQKLSYKRKGLTTEGRLRVRPDWITPKQRRAMIICNLRSRWLRWTCTIPRRVLQ
jgi:hypothetical protein